MVTVSAWFIFIIGMIVGLFVGALGVVFIAFRYGKENKNGRSNKEGRV